MRSFSANSGQTQSLTIRSREKTEQNCDRKSNSHFIQQRRDNEVRNFSRRDTNGLQVFDFSEPGRANNIDSHISAILLQALKHHYPGPSPPTW